MQVAMSEVLVLLFPLHSDSDVTSHGPCSVGTSAMSWLIHGWTNLISFLEISQPHSSIKYFSGGFVDSLYRAVGWGWSTGRKEYMVIQGISPLFQGNPSVLPFGVRSWGLHPAAPSQCSALMGMMVLLALVGRAGNLHCTLPKGVCRISTLVHKTVRSKVPTGTVTWDKLKEKLTFFFFGVSTHLFSSSSFVKKNKMFNN